MPKTTTEEEEVQLIWGGPCISYTNPVLSPRGEARSDLAIALGLRDKLAARDALTADFLPWADQRSFNEFLLGESGITMEELRVTGFAEFPYKLGNFDETGFATTSGKVELFRKSWIRWDWIHCRIMYSKLPTLRVRGTNQFPLVLLTGLREKTYHHSRFRDQAWARRVSPDPIVQIHPETAAVYNIDDAEWVSSNCRNLHGVPGTGTADGKYAARLCCDRHGLVGAFER